LPIVSRWGNLADNPGCELAWFFFFGVVSCGKDCAVVTSNSPDDDVDADANVEPDADTNVKPNADANDNDGGSNNAAADNDDGNDNDEKDSDVDDNCRFDSNVAFFIVSAPLLFDLPFLTTFGGVTIEIDGLHLLVGVSSDRV
jgi:hypothetical protein